eukprot:gnl/TRDRNA2_/TRDRNA2_84811_c0_seq1.p1 gnl/TRDRNA2_/TRDRNA2_84811_c0~~gnl/TRDRNA2_/TRDRNA2_84811_c0_seq1.p1  ORF type:complete len:518 (+),score=50.89 gnl/TRDRNA2_/TRDRNA2_84811_c0_seq1:120-1673(+)
MPSETTKLAQHDCDNGTFANEEPKVELSEVVENFGLRLIHIRLLISQFIVLFIGSAIFSAIPYALDGFQKEFAISKQAAGMTMSVQMAGGVVGVLLFGWLNDKIGRWRCIMVETFLTLLLSLLHLAIPVGQSWFIALLALRFLIGIPYSGLALLSIVHLLEFLPTGLRAGMSAVAGVGWNVGSFYVIFLAKHYEHNWRMLLCGPAIPAVVLMFYMFSLPESARWLLVTGHRKESQRVVDTVFSSRLLSDLGTPLAFTRTPGNLVVSDAQEDESKDERSLMEQIGALLGRKLRRTTILACLAFFLINAVDAFFTYAPDVLKQLWKSDAVPFGVMNYGVLATLVGTFSAGILLDVVGRLTTLVLSFSAAGCSLIVMALAPAHPIILLMYVVLEFASALMWSAISMYVMEIFPTDLRGLGSSAALFCSRIAGITGPIALGAIMDGGGIGKAGPIQILLYCTAALAFCGALTSMAIPTDTTGSKMQDRRASVWAEYDRRTPRCLEPGMATMTRRQSVAFRM